MKVKGIFVLSNKIRNFDLADGRGDDSKLRPLLGKAWLTNEGAVKTTVKKLEHLLGKAFLAKGGPLKTTVKNAWASFR
jgi:hypothetical protein